MASATYLPPPPGLASHDERPVSALAIWFMPWLLSTASHLLLILALALFYEPTRGVEESGAGETIELTCILTGNAGGSSSAAADAAGEEQSATIAPAAAPATPASAAVPTEAPRELPELELHPQGELAAQEEIADPVELQSVTNDSVVPGPVEESEPQRDETGALAMLRRVESGTGNGSGSSAHEAGGTTGRADLNRALAKGAAETGVFGLSGVGYKFVYVFDRSGSMDGHGGAPLAAAKSELIHSLERLEKMHQFQIIFYNEHPRVFTLSGNDGRLAFGTDQNKRLAERFVNGITADGATQHEEAILLALGMNPDVIFFLTDADEPSLSAKQLAHIARRNNGTSINTVEFGYGPKSGGENFLVRLARQNGGAHAYVDIAELPPAERMRTN